MNKLSCLMVPPLLGSNESAGGGGGIPNFFFPVYHFRWYEWNTRQLVQILSSWGFFFLFARNPKFWSCPGQRSSRSVLKKSKSVVEQILWSLNRTCLPNYPWYFCSNGGFVVLISPQIVTTTVCRRDTGSSCVERSVLEVLGFARVEEDWQNKTPNPLSEGVGLIYFQYFAFDQTLRKE